MKKYFTRALLLSLCFSLSVAYAQMNTNQTGDAAPEDQTGSLCTEITRNLTYKKSKDSNTNGEVSDLQSFLQDEGFLKTDPTGNFGAATFKAVKSFQTQNRLLSSGYVGPITRAKIKELSCSGSIISHVGLPEGCNSSSGYSITTGNSCGAPVTACTMEMRFCSDGSGMPRGIGCEWHPEQCDGIQIGWPIPTPVSTSSSPIVISPNAGVTWVAGQAYTIKWNVSNTLMGRWIYFTNSADASYLATHANVGYVDSPVNQYTYTVPLSTLPGQYYVTVCGAYCDGIHSKSVLVNVVAPTSVVTNSFVPTVEFIGKPTLSLQYDSTYKESKLVGKAKVKITAGSLPVSTAGFAQLLALFVNESFTTSNNTTYQVFPNGQNYGNIPDTIPAGTSLTVTVYQTAPTRELLPGSYVFKSSVRNLLPTAKINENGQPTYNSCDGGSCESGIISGPVMVIGEPVTGRNVLNGQSSYPPVKVIGETSPYITKVLTGQNPSYYIITGSRFTPYSNQVSINGITKTLSSDASYGFSGSGPAIQFNPSDFNLVSGNGYLVQVSTKNGLSNGYFFNYTNSGAPTPNNQMMSAVVTSGPTLALTYDSNNKEASLVAKTTILVTAGNNDLNVVKPTAQSWPLNPLAFNLSVLDTNNGGGGMSGTLNVSTQAEDRGNNWVIPAGSSNLFYLSESFNPKQFFAGTYRTVPSAIFNGGDILVSSTNSNYVTIIGETSPYIKGVTIDSNGFANVQGLRFNGNYNTVTLNGVVKQISTTANGQVIAFSLKDFGITSPGTYFIQVSNNEGASNNFTFNFSGNINQNNLVVTSPTSGQRYVVGSQVPIYWNSSSIPSSDTIKIEVIYSHNDTTYPGGQVISDIIIDSTQNTGIYFWNPPEYYSQGLQEGSFSIKVTSSSGVSASSAGNFILAKSQTPIQLLTALSPTTGSVYGVGQSVPIKWTPKTNDQYSISLLRKNDPTFIRMLISNIDYVGLSSLSWTIPSSITAGNDYYIKISEGFYRSKTGYSPTFTIGSNNTPISPVSFAKTAGWASTSVTPGQTNQKIGSFSVQAGQGEGVVVSDITVGLNTGAGTMLSAGQITNLTIKDGQNPVSYPVGNPTTSNKISTSNSVLKSSTKTYDVYADISTAASGLTVTPTMKLSYYGEITKTPQETATVTGPVVTASNLVSAKLIPQVGTTMNSQFLIGGQQQIALGGFAFTQSGSANMVIKDMTFTVPGGTIDSISVNGRNGTVIGGQATVYNVDKVVTPGSSATYMPVTISLVCANVSVGCSGVSNSDVYVKLSNVTYNNGISMQSLAADISTPAHKLVGTKPTITMNPTNSSSLVNGLVKLGEFTVSADAAGAIGLKQIPVQISISGSAAILPSSIELRDGSGVNVITGSNSLSSSGNFIFTNPRLISKGSSETYTIYAKVSGVAGAAGTQNISLSLGNRSSFIWKDIVGNVDSLTGSLLINYPTVTSTVNNKDQPVIVDTPVCTNMYWFDTTNKDCSQKSFCGTYMYYGLQTFQTQESCKTALPPVSQSIVPSLSVSSPNGGETFTYGQPGTITWNASSNIETVTIAYVNEAASLNTNGGFTGLIASGVPNTGSYSFVYMAPLPLDTKLKIRVFGNYKVGTAGYQSIIDDSDNFFVVKPGTVSVTAAPSVLGAHTSFVSCTNLLYNLHRGAESASVTTLQNFLTQTGLLEGGITGFYGDKTVEAVKDYQASKGLPTTGMVYDFTRKAIMEESCR